MNAGTTDIISVEAEMQYLSPQSRVLRRFTAPGASVNTGVYQPHVVRIRNGRPVQGEFSLEIHGFELLRHRSAVADFTDRAEVDRLYLPEVVDFVRGRTGADEVVSRGAVLRRSAAPGEHGSQPQAALVHIDYSSRGARMSAARAYAEQFPDHPPYRRVMATSLWRAFSPPPQDWPLAVCDFRSLRGDEGLDNELYFVDRVPEDPLAAEVDESQMVTSGSEFVYSPEHEWWYFPDMTQEEVLFFVFNDSDHGRAWRVLHSAFRDPTVSTEVPRHSVEVRTFAYFL